MKKTEGRITKKKKRNKNKSKNKNWSFLFGFFILVYLPSVFNWIYGGNVTIERIRYGTIEKSFNSNAVIIRDSVTYQVEYDGVFIPDIEEGERAPAMGRIASVYKESAIEQMEKLRTKERQILEAMQGKAENSKIYDSDLRRIENEIRKFIFEMAKETKDKSMNGVANIESKINELTGKKALVLGDIGTTDVYINTLNEKKVNLEQIIDLNRTEIDADCTGVVSYFIDGYEGVLDVGMLGEINSDIISGIKYTPFETNSSHEVKAGEPFVKVVRGLEYFLALATDNDDARAFLPGDRLEIRINDIEKVTNAEIVYRKKEDNGNTVLVLKTDRYMGDMLEMRIVNIDVIIDSYEGLMVYEDALVEPDYDSNMAGIMLAKGNYASHTRVKILGSNGDIAVIDDEDGHDNTIKLYDSYILTPKNINDGQVIRN